MPHYLAISRYRTRSDGDAATHPQAGPSSDLPTYGATDILSSELRYERSGPRLEVFRHASMKDETRTGAPDRHILQVVPSEHSKCPSGIPCVQQAW